VFQGYRTTIRHESDEDVRFDTAVLLVIDRAGGFIGKARLVQHLNHGLALGEVSCRGRRLRMVGALGAWGSRRQSLFVRYMLPSGPACLSAVFK
jgi:hypothetical protein